MFLGTYTPKVDDKGRLFLPAKFREELMAGLVVTTGQERCLTVYKLADFAESPPASGRPDHGQGRPRLRPLPRRQRQPGHPRQAGPDHHHADPARVRLADRDVMVIGVINRIEIWDPSRWEAYNQQNQETFADISEEVFPGL